MIEVRLTICGESQSSIPAILRNHLTSACPPDVIDLVNPRAEKVSEILCDS